jgi:zinc protease
LREVVREDMSGTYGVRVAGSFQEIPRGQYRLNVSWGCDPDREEELETAVWGVLDEFMAKGADETTLTKVRETHSREHETQLRRTSSGSKSSASTISGSRIHTRSLTSAAIWQS